MLTEIYAVLGVLAFLLMILGMINGTYFKKYSITLFLLLISACIFGILSYNSLFMDSCGTGLIDCLSDRNTEMMLGEVLAGLLIFDVVMIFVYFFKGKE